MYMYMYTHVCVCVRLSTCQLGHTLRRPEPAEPGNGVQQGIDRKDEGVACIEQEGVLNEAPWPSRWPPPGGPHGPEKK